ncbi:MAG TPA: TCAD7 domain-containing protein, partial [Longimicrobium sp.]|nr:TCAD7 domain-containing protein [Longimicrobium sp.]
MYRQPLILDGAMPAADAGGRLLLYGDAYPVVVRRQDGYRLLYYLFTVTALRAGLDAAAPGPTLAEALALGGMTPAPVGRGGARAEVYPAVLLDENDQVLAVLEAEADFPVAASRGATLGKPRFGGFRGSTKSSGHPGRRRGSQREAFPWLSAPAVVHPEERFELVIGLTEAARLASSGAVVLPAGEKAVELGIQVVADGFDAPEGWRRTLHVRLDDVGATSVAVPLAAHPGAEPARISLLMVHFTCRGAPCGVASRRIVVARPARGAAPAASSTPAGAADGRVVLEPERAPDLTIRIDKPDANQATGRFVWSIESPHDVAPLAALAVTDLGLDAASFARTVIGSVTGNEGPLLDNAVRGVAMRIA